MIVTPVILSFALASFKLVQAQLSNTTLGIEAIEAHFTQSGLEPSLLPTFDPIALLTLTYDTVGAVAPGTPLTQDDVADTPTLLLTPANNTVKLGGNYTLVMADAGPVGTDETQGQTRHWLVNGVTINGTAVLNINTKTGMAVTKYAGPAPPTGSGAHRYTILLYAQPESFVAPDGLNVPDVGVDVFNLQDYVKTSGLGAVVAGIYYTVENGAASVTPSATSAVITSTLPAAQSTTVSTPPASQTSQAAPSGSKQNAAYINAASVPKAFVAAIVGFFFL